MELEKSGPISRSANFSMSFRAEPCLNSKASLLLQKESRQQDPYGIFNLEDSIPRDIGCYKNLVKFTSSSLDPKCISSSSYIPLLQKLRYFSRLWHPIHALMSCILYDQWCAIVILMLCFQGLYEWTTKGGFAVFVFTAEISILDQHVQCLYHACKLSPFTKSPKDDVISTFP